MVSVDVKHHVHLLINNSFNSRVQREAVLRGNKINFCSDVDVDVDRFYAALFSAFEQTHCALVAFDAK